MSNLWEWDNDPGVRNKKCAHCLEPMLYDRAQAVKYKDTTYHSYCLLTVLAEFKEVANKSTANVSNPFNWGWGVSP